MDVANEEKTLSDVHTRCRERVGNPRGVSLQTSRKCRFRTQLHEPVRDHDTAAARGLSHPHLTVESILMCHPVTAQRGFCGCAVHNLYPHFRCHDLTIPSKAPRVRLKRREANVARAS